MSDTDFKAVPMKLEEARYSYRNSQQISSQTGLIGYLRADMGTTGTEFWSTWNDFRKDLKDFLRWGPPLRRLEGGECNEGDQRPETCQGDMRH